MPRDVESVTIIPDSGLSSDNSIVIVDWDENDPENPYNWSNASKWAVTWELAAATFSISFASSAYSAGITATQEAFHISETVAVLGISLYVLGFGFGPLLFAPLCEVYGRRVVFLGTMIPFTLCHLGGSLAQNATTLLVMRFFAGMFGSSPLANGGAQISDLFRREDLGTATAVYSVAPFLGPVIGPIVGGFVTQTPRLGWRFNFWLMFILGALSSIIGLVHMPETYGPTLLRRRAQKLQAASQYTTHYITIYEAQSGDRSLLSALRQTIHRPFLFLLTEPIVTLISIYISVAYGILYAFFAAFPLVFQESRGFNAWQTGLTFIGVGVGIVGGMLAMIVQNRLYARDVRVEKERTGGKAPPESRLYLALIGAVLMPVGLFWFAWTSAPPTFYIAPILACIPFGAGIAQILQCLTAYLIDAYGPQRCASALASTIVLRSCFAAAFPLFVPALYQKVGQGAAGSVFAGASAICFPVPFLFYKYGAWLRAKSKHTVRASSEPPTGHPQTGSSAALPRPQKKKSHDAQSSMTTVETEFMPVAAFPFSPLVVPSVGSSAEHNPSRGFTDSVDRALVKKGGSSFRLSKDIAGEFEHRDFSSQLRQGTMVESAGASRGSAVLSVQ